MVAPHKTVRTHSLLSSKRLSLFSKKARKIMAKSNDATAFKHSKVDELFNLVKQNDKVLICVGNNRVSRKQFKTFKEADNYIASKPYELLINVSILIQKLQENENKNSTKSAEDEQTSSKNN